MSAKRISEAERQRRFWAKVDASGDCWEYNGARDADGYGVVSVYGGNMGAHRYSYLIEHGAIPDGKRILHRCDNPSCVRPAHLYAGSAQDNMDDRKERGRNTGWFYRQRTEEEKRAHSAKLKGRKHPPDCAHCAAVRKGSRVQPS